ncbi:MAG: hypothetical protein H8E90_02675, partial [Anaerolineales bacterium]|nr:hypothetical protein [Anaerolineales bacterium]
KVPTPTPIPTPTEALVFEDDFSDNSAGWLEVDAPVRKLWIEGGEYHYMVKTGWEGASEYGWLEKRYSDFVLTTVARQVDDLAGYYGLAFREDDAAVSYYYFIVSGDGYYAVGKRMGREWINMVDWTFSPAINQGQGENILQVVCVGDKISAYVNDQELATVRDDTFAEGYLGLLVGAFDEPGVHVAFDWVMVEPIE